MLFVRFFLTNVAGGVAMLLNQTLPQRHLVPRVELIKTQRSVHHITFVLAAAASRKDPTPLPRGLQ